MMGWWEVGWVMLGWVGLGWVVGLVGLVGLGGAPNFLGDCADFAELK